MIPLRHLASSLCALALLCTAAGAPAQTTIYKQVDAAGRITFTDRPDANLPAQAMTGPALEAPKPKPPAAVVTMTSERSATINANEAARRLAQAEHMRSEGADLLPGERTPGTGTPNERYRQRQERLRVLVEQAQKRANEARMPLLALR